MRERESLEVLGGRVRGTSSGSARLYMLAGFLGSVGCGDDARRDAGVSGLPCCEPDSDALQSDWGYPEECNGIDDDFDGLVDDGPLPGVGEICGRAEGACTTGITACRPDLGCDGRGSCIACVGATEPGAEECNGIDDDCDGQTDERCACGGDCGCDPRDEFPCAAGFFCDCEADADCDCSQGSESDPDCAVNWSCRADPCTGVVCDECEYCDASAGGACRPLCGIVECESWEDCDCGRCIDVSCSTAYGFPGRACGEDEVCDPIRHECVRPPCLDVECAPNEHCRSDKHCAEGGAICVPLCPQCGADERCVCGACVDDSCSDVTCPAPRVCCAGECVIDDCARTPCGTGLRCDPCAGSCVRDACALGLVVCPPGYDCREDRCVPRWCRVCE